MAAFERITIEKAWELPIVQSFNDLSYLKAKEKNEKDAHEERRRKQKMNL